MFVPAAAACCLFTCFALQLCQLTVMAVHLKASAMQWLRQSLLLVGPEKAQQSLVMQSSTSVEVSSD
jgi:hypothetical protein